METKQLYSFRVIIGRIQWACGDG